MPPATLTHAVDRRPGRAPVDPGALDLGAPDPRAAALGAPDLLAQVHARVRRAWRRTLMIGCALVVALVLGMRLAEQASGGTLLAGLPRVDDFFRDFVGYFQADSLFADAETRGSLARWQRNLPEHLLLLLETVNIALFSTLLAFGVATLAAFLASDRFSRSRWLRAVTRRILEAMRGVPELVLALFMAYLLGTGALAGIIAITIHSIGALGKLFAEVIDNAAPQPVDGLASVGAPWAAQMRHGILPGVLPNLASYGLLRLEINVRASAILGFVGAGGIGQELSVRIQQGNDPQTFAIIVLLIVTIIVIDAFSDWLRRRLTRAQGVRG